MVQILGRVCGRRSTLAAIGLQLAVGCMACLFADATRAVTPVPVIEPMSLVLAAVEINPQILAQRSLGEAADHGVKSAVSKFFPSLSVAIERVAAQQGPTPMQDAHGATARVQQPLYTWGRLSAGLSKAEAQQAAAAAEIEEAVQQVSLKVAQVFGDWAAAVLKEQAYRDALTLLRRFEGMATRRIARGVSASAELILIRSRVAQVEADLAAVLAQQAAARFRLGQLTGHLFGPDAVPQTTGWEGAAILQRGAPDAIEEAKLRSPTLRKHIARRNISEHELAERRAGLFPEVYARLERQWGSLTSSGAKPETRFFIGVNVATGPGLSALSELAAIESRQDAARHEMEAAAWTVREQIQNDWIALDAVRARLASLIAAIDSADELVASGERQFLAGKKSWQDLMNSSRDVTQLRAQWAELRASQIHMALRLTLLLQPPGVVATTDPLRRANP